MDPLLNVKDAQRLSTALIADFQDGLIRAGRMGQDALIHSVLASQPLEPRALQIVPNTLEIDSLTLLDLVQVFNRFFGLSATGIEDYLIVRKSLGDWSELILHHFEKVGSEAEVTFTTSGSSGPQKHVSHVRAHLDAEVVAIQSLLGQEAEGATSFIAAVPPHHIYGFLWSVLLPRAMDLPCFDCHRGASSAVRRQCPSGSVVLATPYLWERYAAFGLSFPQGVTGISSGGPTTEATWESAETLGLSRMIEVYGSTETGGVGWRNAPDAPFTLMAHLHRTHDEIQRLSDGSSLAMQDEIDWASPRTFRLIGRSDRVVQVAATNVCLDAVEAAVRETGLVDEVAVRLDGDRLKAFVVARAPQQTDLEGRLRHALTHLPSVARPTCFKLGQSLPRNAIGKLQDW